MSVQLQQRIDISPWDEVPLNPRHRAEIEASGISASVALDRGYRTATTKADISRLGFGRSQQIPPGIIMPIYGVAGVLTGYQYKPDTPRILNGKAIKYESPGKSTPQLDVPQIARGWVLDQDLGLFLTEGIKKGDAAASRELAVVSFSGVWNWRTEDVLAELDQIPLKNRPVYLTFDSDWRRNPTIRLALKRLGKMLEHRGAIVYVISLPELTIGIKTGLDDYFVAGGTRQDLTAKYAVAFVEFEELAEADDQSGLVDDVVFGSPHHDGARVPAGYTLSQDAIYKGSKLILPTAAIVTARLIDRETRDESIQVAFRDRGSWRTFSVTRDVIAISRKISELARLGLPVTSNSARDVVDWFAAYMVTNTDTLPLIITSATLGWKDTSGFLLSTRFIPENDTTPHITFAPADTGSAQQAAAFATSGTLKGWIEVTRLVADLERVKFAIHASLAAPLLEILHCPSFIVDYCGPTTGGKTTSLRVAGSVWGPSDPVELPSILATFQSTRVYKERIAAMSHGLPVIVDETQQAAKASEIEAFVYDFCSSQGRGRGSLQGMQATSHSRTVALISGEASAAAATEAGGTKARILTLWGRPFGKSEHAADLISTLLLGISEHHGHAGPVMVEWMLAHRDEWPTWRATYRERVSECAHRCGGGPVITRIAGYVAAVELAAELAGLAGVLPWEADYVSDGLLREIAGEARSADVAAEALLDVLSWATGRLKSFFSGDDRQQPLGGWLGRCDKYPDGTWSSIAFTRDHLREALAANGFRDDRSITRQWAERGWLEIGKGEEKARRTKKTRMGGKINTWCYVIPKSAEESARTAMEGELD